MSQEIPESVAQYFGHDKISLFGTGPMPAAPAAPPGSTGRKAGDTALADALAKVGSAEPRPGQRPTRPAAGGGLARAMRSRSERALVEHVMKRTVRARGGTPPYGTAGVLFGGIFAPVWSRVPWGLKRRIVAMTSGVRDYRSS